MHMSTPRSQHSDSLDPSSALPPPYSLGFQRNGSAYDGATYYSSNPNPTYAAFSPATLSATTASAAAKRRSTILVHQKSPLLLATPPQITRALAYSHPFLLPLNKLAGLLSWTTGEPWKSFLLLAAFWATVLYGDYVIRLMGPLVLVLFLIGGMYGRRFSPLSSSGWGEPGQDGAATGGESKPGKAGRKSGKGKNLSVDGLPDSKSGKAGASGTGTPGGHQRSQHSISEITNTRHQKTLDEIVETLKEFTARCNILLEPLLELTDFLSTQRTATSATTRPALTTLFVRILLCTPFWFALTLPPLRIITTRRVILVSGTLCLTWHAQVMRVARAILWRSGTVRNMIALVTGLHFEMPATSGAKLSPTSPAGSKNVLGKTADKTVALASRGQRESELTKALRRARVGTDTGVRFTFIIYENQRRWVGLGWTNSLFAYERAAWTDEHNNNVPPKSQFELPEVEDGSRMRWRWVVGSRWRVDGVPDEAVMPAENDQAWDYDGPGGRMGWVYYDNKWQNGKRGQDGWARWTRRRKWYRDAELVEVDDDDDQHDDEDDEVQSQQDGRNQSSSTIAPTVPTRPAHQCSTRSVSSSKNVEKDHDEDYDSSSVLSSSSRSGRFKSPSLRRRVADVTQRSRRTSGAAAEEDGGSLGTQVDLAIQGAAKEGGSWGIGDEVRMGLE